MSFLECKRCTSIIQPEAKIFIRNINHLNQLLSTKLICINCVEIRTSVGNEYRRDSAFNSTIIYKAFSRRKFSMHLRKGDNLYDFELSYNTHFSYPRV